MKKAILAAAVCVFIFAACAESDSGSDKDTVKTLRDKAFEVFNKFNYKDTVDGVSTPRMPLPPEGFDVKPDGVTDGVNYGKVTLRQYRSNSIISYSTGEPTGSVTRNVNVYTPPGYDSGTAYPVLYLLHGIGGNENEWVNSFNPSDNVYAKLNEILSNLIIAGKVKPLIAVIPNVRASNPDIAPTTTEGQYSQENMRAFGNFINDLRNDLMPFIENGEAGYIILEGRENHAIAGLSMGGATTLNIILNEIEDPDVKEKMYEKFGYVGAFSAPGEGFTSAAEAIPKEYRDNTFLMLATGDVDGVIKVEFVRQFKEVITADGITPAYYEIPGGNHGFYVWNNALYYFTQCIFRE